MKRKSKTEDQNIITTATIEIYDIKGKQILSTEIKTKKDKIKVKAESILKSSKHGESYKII